MEQNCEQILNLGWEEEEFQGKYRQLILCPVTFFNKNDAVCVREAFKSVKRHSGCVLFFPCE